MPHGRGREVKQYKNIELPDSIKEVELLDFHFNVPADGKITFEIHYASDVLPETFPEPRAKVTRAEKSHAGRGSRSTGTGGNGTGHHPGRTSDTESGRTGGSHSGTGNRRGYG